MYYTDDTTDLILPPPEGFQPVYWTPMNSPRSLGYDMIKFIEQYMKPPRTNSMTSGEFRLTDWQKWLLISMFELKEDGFLRYRKVYWQISRKNGKSFLMTAILLYFTVKAKQGDQNFIIANNRTMADIIFEDVKDNLARNPELLTIATPFQHVIKHNHFKATLRTLASNRASTQGIGPFIAVGDEVQLWDLLTGNKGFKLMKGISDGSGDRDESWFGMITTAGEDLNGVAYAQYILGKKICLGEVEQEDFGVFIWEAEEDDDISDPEIWMKANPALRSGLQSLDAMRADYEDGLLLDITNFERYKLNKWIRHGDNASFLSEFYWKEAKNTSIPKLPPAGTELALGFDGSLSDDSTGIVGVCVNTGQAWLLASWEHPAGDSDWMLNPKEVEDKVEEIFEIYTVLKFYLDPNHYRDQLMKWRKRYGKQVVRDIPQTIRRMADLSDAFKAALYTKEITHNGDPKLTQHALNAIESHGRTPIKESKKSKNKIDFLIAFILAAGARAEIVDLRDRSRSWTPEEIKQRKQEQRERRIAALAARKAGGGQ